jgi:hypothetical protein
MRLRYILTVLIISASVNSFALGGWAGNVGNDASPGDGNAHAAPRNYQVIIDAGSSGTRVYVYAKTQEDRVSLPKFEQLLNLRKPTPLAATLDFPTKTESLITELLGAAQDKITQESAAISNIEVNILATAGMRKLSPEEQQKIYERIPELIRRKGFAVGKIKTLAGYEEGIYTWAALNYLAESFTAQSRPRGSIEVGGSSMQIVYPIESTPSNVDHSDYKRVTLVNNGTQYLVFSRTWLGLGDNDSLAAMRQLGQTQLCYPSGYSESNFSGHFNLQQCKLLYQKVIGAHLVMVSPAAAISFNGISSPAITLIMWGIESLPLNLGVTARRYCETSFQAVIEKAKAVSKDPNLPEKYIIPLCAKSAYIEQLLTTLKQTKPSYQAPKTINGAEINWTLGYYIIAQIESAGT